MEAEVTRFFSKVEASAGVLEAKLMGNPFDNPTTIREPKNFVGREDHLQRIFDFIKNKQNVSLVGARRIGKTSLLNCLRNKTIQERFNFQGKDFLFLYLDLQDRMLKKQIDLFDDLNFLLRQQCLTYPEEGISYKDEAFTYCIDEFQQRGIYPVLMLDTFDEIDHYAPIDLALFNFLRSQGNRGQISYITASVDPLGDIFRKRLLQNNMVSPFFNIFGTVRLRPFSQEEARNLLISFSARENRPFTEKEVNWVLSMAGCHPYLLQHVGAVLFAEKQAKGTGKINFQRVKKEAYQSLENHFADCWYMLDSDEARRLRAEIEQENAEDGDFPELSSSALFRDYLHSISQRETAAVEALLVEEMLTSESVVEAEITENVSVIEMSIDDFQKLLDKSRRGDQRSLGESSLILLPFIASQVKSQNVAAPVAKGLLVREALKKALEQMRGQGLRSDGHNDWLFYNILYYRYFMPSARYSHDLIAGKLGISTRQYFRIRKQAIQTLWQILLEMKETISSEITV
jgi:AAA+ ATPase superfamily predicted ATPase